MTTNLSERRNRRTQDLISPGQCRAARAFLSLTREELGTAAGLTGATLQSFERGVRVPHQNNLQALRAFLESKGVQFIPQEDGTDGLLLPIDMPFPPKKGSSRAPATPTRSAVQRRPLLGEGRLQRAHSAA
jgi:transcriptional regulator with XRE-family HTH domain